MWEWIKDSANALAMFASYGTLVVWLVYLQILVIGIKRRRRANILITRGKGADLKASLLVSNMSAEAIYVKSLIVRIEMDGQAIEHSLSDLESISDQDEYTQGPLDSGEWMRIGTFEEVVEHLAEEEGGSAENWRDELGAIELTVAAVYGPDDLLAGATRRFEVDSSQQPSRMRPSEPDTRQMRSQRERRALKSRIKAFI